MSQAEEIFVEFKDSTTWRKAYQRNNKSKEQKNLRCFPDCSVGFGHQDGFCGQSITITLHFPSKSLEGDDFVAAGEFAVDGSKPVAPGNTLTLASINNHGTPEDEKMTYIEGLRIDPHSKDPTGRTKILNFEFNRNLKGWHYGFLGSKKTRDLYHVFRAYVLQRAEGGAGENGEALYRVVASVDSPRWQMYCRRRKKYTEDMLKSKHQTADPLLPKQQQQPSPPPNESPLHALREKNHDLPPHRRHGLPPKSGGFHHISKPEYGMKLGIDTSVGGYQNIPPIRSPFFGSSSSPTFYGGNNNYSSMGGSLIPVQGQRRIRDPNSGAYLHRMDSSNKLRESTGFAPSLGLKRKSDELSPVAYDAERMASRRRSDPCTAAHTTNSHRIRSNSESRTYSVKLEAMELPDSYGHSQSHRGRNSPQDVYCPKDYRWELAVKVLAQLHLPNPLREQRLDFSGPQEKIEQFAVSLRDLLIHLDEMRRFPSLRNLPLHVESYLTSSKGLSEIEHFVLYVISSRDFDESIHEFAVQVQATAVNPYNIVSFGLSWLTKLLSCFITEGAKAAMMASSRIGRMHGNNSGPKLHKSSPQGTGSGGKHFSKHHYLGHEEEETMHGWVQHASKHSSEYEPFPIAYGHNSGYGKHARSSALPQASSPTAFGADLLEMCATPHSTVNLDDLDYLMQPTPRHISSSQGGSCVSGKPGLSGSVAPPLLNLHGLTPTNSFVLSPKGGLIFSPKHSFSSIKLGNDSRRIDTDVALVSPRVRSPLYADIESFISQSGHDSLLLSPPTPVAAFDLGRPSGDAGPKSGSLGGSSTSTIGGSSGSSRSGSDTNSTRLSVSGTSE